MLNRGWRHRWRPTTLLLSSRATAASRPRRPTSPSPSWRPRALSPGFGSEAMLIACVGDVHGCWNRESAEALSSLRPDLSLFVGDFGEEDVDLVAKIARVPERKAVILGNHDAWYGAKGRDDYPMDGVEKQLDLLGDEHVGLSALTLPDLELSVVGCRPFSAGGNDWKRFRKFYSEL